MSVDIKGTLSNYLTNGGTAINIPPAIGSIFGTAIGTVISEIFSGSIQIGGANFTFTGDENSATITGTGSNPPLLSSVSATFTFTVENSGASMSLDATVVSNFTLSQAWPTELNTAPFDNLVVTGGGFGLDVNFGDLSFLLTVTVSGSTFEGSSMGTGLLEVQYTSGSLGFLAGLIVEGTWTPFAHWPPLQNLTVTEAGVFLSTITASDLSAFDPLKLPYLPSNISPGLTFFAELAMEGDIADLAQFLPSGSTLVLTATLGSGDTSLAAILNEPVVKSAAWQFTTFELDWDISGSSISLTIDANFTPDSSGDLLVLSGVGTFNYGAVTSLTIGLTATLTGAWAHPFGLPNLTIDEFSIGLSLSEEGGLDFDLGGTITVGTDPGTSVILTLAGGIEDFEVPSFVYADLQPADKDKLVTVPQLVTDFIPDLNLNDFPFLNNISVGELQLLAVAAPTPFEGKVYQPGFGIAGNIDFYGYDLDFAFTLVTSPNIAVQAKGSITENNGPIKVYAGGVQILLLSDATQKTGPSACIDTTGGGTFCGSVNGSGLYFSISAYANVLGLISLTVTAQATGDGFDFELKFTSPDFTEQLGCTFFPKEGDFAALTDTQFLPDSITLGPYGPIPSFTITTPTLVLVCAVGTIMPTSPIGPNNWMPSAPPYFYLYVQFDWGKIGFELDAEIDLNTVVTAFASFDTFVKNWLLNSAADLFGDILKDAEQLAQLLYQIGLDFYDVLDALIKQFTDWTIEALTEIVTAIFDASGACGVATADASITSSSAEGMIQPIPRVLADLTESEGGQKILYHYYLNRPEIDRILRASGSTRTRSQQIVSSYLNTPEGQSGRIVPVVIRLIEETGKEGSDALKASISEVVPELEKHRDQTYQEFLESLKK